MSKFQIGTKGGHRAQEHVFVLKSFMQLSELCRKPVIICLWDISKYFDRESLVDVMGDIYKLGVQGKVYRLLYEMNRDTVVKVKTPVGDTDEAETGEGLGQGTIVGAILSAANLGQGVEKYFHDSENEVFYGQVRLQPMLFQDDVARLSA